MTQNNDEFDELDRKIISLVPAEYRITESEINEAWGNADFGGGRKLFIIAETLIKVAGEYATGATALAICQDLKLVGKSKVRPRLTKKGKRLMYHLNGRGRYTFSVRQEIKKAQKMREAIREITSHAKVLEHTCIDEVYEIPSVAEDLLLLVDEINKLNQKLELEND